jgi:hypothetical protein
MDWELIPNVGLLTLRLGDARAAVRSQFGDPRVFRRTADAPDTDQFPQVGIMVTYGSGEVVTFIELTAPAAPTLLGILLIGRELDEVLGKLRDEEVQIELDPDGANVPGWRLGFYAPSGLVEGVSIGD